MWCDAGAGDAYPSAAASVQATSTVAAVPTFPRTVPRTVSIQRNDHTGLENTNRMSLVAGDRPASPSHTVQAASSSTSSAHWQQQQQQQPVNGDVTSAFVNSTTPGDRYMYYHWVTQMMSIQISQIMDKHFLQVRTLSCKLSEFANTLLHQNQNDPEWREISQF